MRREGDKGRRESGEGRGREEKRSKWEKKGGRGGREKRDFIRWTEGRFCYGRLFPAPPGGHYCYYYNFYYNP